MIINLEVPDPLYKRLKARAAIRGMRVKDFITIFLEEGLDQLSSPLPVSGEEVKRADTEI